MASSSLVCCVGAVALNWLGLHAYLPFVEALQTIQQCIANYQTASDSCLRLDLDLPEKDFLLQSARYLQQQHLSIWYGAVIPSRADALGLDYRGICLTEHKLTDTIRLAIQRRV